MIFSRPVNKITLKPAVHGVDTRLLEAIICNKLVRLRNQIFDDKKTPYADYFLDIQLGHRRI